MERYEFAGKTLKTKSNVGKSILNKIDLGDKEFIAEDYWININGISWRNSDRIPAASDYAFRIGSNGNHIPLNDNVVYGKIDGLGYLFHEDELITDVDDIFEYDENDNLIHFKDSTGEEKWWKYDENDNLIHYKDSDGDEEWYDYDENGHCIHYKDSDGFESWREYDENGNRIHYKDSDCDEYWKTYDKNGRIVHYKDSNGFEAWREYDENGHCIHYKNSNGIDEDANI